MMASQQIQSSEPVRSRMEPSRLVHLHEQQQQNAPIGEILVERLCTQIEYYFSPANLAKDAFLTALMRNHDGGVPAEIIARFPKVRAIGSALLHTPLEDPADTKWLLLAVEASQLVTMNASRAIIPCNNLNTHHQNYQVIKDGAVASPARPLSSEGAVHIHPVDFGDHVMYTQHQHSHSSGSPFHLEQQQQHIPWFQQTYPLYMSPPFAIHYHYNMSSTPTQLHPPNLVSPQPYPAGQEDEHVGPSIPPRQVFVIGAPPEEEQNEPETENPRRTKKRPTRRVKHNRHSMIHTSLDQIGDQSSSSSSPTLSISPSQSSDLGKMTTTTMATDEVSSVASLLSSSSSPTADTRQRRRSHKRTRRRHAAVPFSNIHEFPLLDGAVRMTTPSCPLGKWASVVKGEHTENAMAHLSLEDPCLLPLGA